MAEIDLALAKQHMLRKQLHARGISDPNVLAAMARVPREAFVGPEWRAQAYADRALPIACSQTISQPYIVGLMTQALELTGHEVVLEIGTGSGYQTAILALLAREVISVERHAELSEQAAERLKALGCQNVSLICGDGTLGWPARAPYDRILVTAAAQRCPPRLLDQMADPGAMVIPIGGEHSQVLQLIRKRSGQLVCSCLSACRFVPLVGEDGWPG